MPPRVARCPHSHSIGPVPRAAVFGYQGGVHHHAGHAAAFAEGRRLREASRMRRQPPRRWAGPAPWVLLMVLIPGVIGAAIASNPFAAMVFAIVTMVLIGGSTPFLVLSVGVAMAVRRRRRARLRRGGAPGTAPLPARPPVRPRPDAVWAHARQRFHSLRMAYAAYECDAMEVLRLPALADVSVPSTARFVDAFAEAQALETDAFPPGSHAASFIAAVEKAERAWRAARDAAERIRLSNLSPAERSTVERVIKLLTTARDSDSDPERLAAYARARSELARLERAGVINLPHAATAALDAANPKALPA
jgi:hypothetical protein